MCLKIFEIIFGISSLLLILLMVLREMGITKQLSPMRASDYVSSIAAFMLAYIVFAFLIAIFVPSGLNKIIFALFFFTLFVIKKDCSLQSFHFVLNNKTIQRLYKR